MEFPTQKTYSVIICGLGLAVVAAVAIFLVIDQTLGASRPVSLAHASSIETGSGGQAQPRITHIVPQDADQSVKDMLADGLVTFEEYEHAIDNTMVCLEEKGVAHTQPAYDESRKQFSYITRIVGLQSSGAAADDECSMRYERDIQVVWLSQQWVPTMSEEEAEAASLKCVESLGRTFSSFGDLREYWESTTSDSLEFKRCVKMGIYRVDTGGQERPWPTPTSSGQR